ncbi:MAG: hypothetical protein ACE5KJ_03825 [Candidatus Zixiibacteriota bacterium]
MENERLPSVTFLCSIIRRLIPFIIDETVVPHLLSFSHLKTRFQGLFVFFGAWPRRGTLFVLILPPSPIPADFLI